MSHTPSARRARIGRTVAEWRYRGRNARYRPIFDTLADLDLRTVLDVGGGRFADDVGHLTFDRWVVVEPDVARLPTVADRRVQRVAGDGQHLPVRTSSVDTVLSIQVLEHVFEPLEMLRELQRAVRPGGHVVLVVPQTANVHELPHHYQNFTRYWLEEAAQRLDLEIVTYVAMGGAWSSIASRLVLQYATVFRVPGHHEARSRRGWKFWALAPLGALVTAMVVPVALLLGTNDLEEEANNHLVVLRTRVDSPV